MAAHLAYDVFSWYKYQIGDLTFPTSNLEVESLSDCGNPDRSLLVSF